jgi:FSR family fosmidomycin resistance protein-like MFS transporter
MNRLVKFFNLPTSHKFWSVSIGHFANDTLMQVGGPVLLTFLSTTIMPMSLTQIGFAISAKQLVGALSQPFFGLRADKTGGRFLGSLGLALTIASFIVSVVVALTTGSYYLMLIPFILQGIGSGALHPVGALHAVETDEEHAASSTAYFFLMGQLGLGIGPALIGLLLDFGSHGGLLPFGNWIIDNINFAPIFWVALAAVPSVFFMYSGIPAERKLKHDDKPRVKMISSVATWMPFVILGTMVIIRSLPNLGSVSFIPSLFEQKDWNPTDYGFITSVYWFSSGFAGVFFGNLADRYDRRYVVMWSTVLSAPPLFFLPFVDGLPAIALALLAGGFSGGSHSIIVIMAQELIPHNKAFASGAILGFIFGAGALGNLIIGIISDSFGLPITFQLMAIAAVISGLMGLMLPKSKPRIIKELA